jgi:tRNA modification GTPase
VRAPGQSANALERLIQLEPSIAGRVLHVSSMSDIASPEHPGVGVSAASGAGLAELRREIAARLSLRAGSVGGRMRALARRALPLLQQQASAPPEAIASEVRRALTLLDEALLHKAPGDVLDLIFSSFCIGK